MALYRRPPPSPPRADPDRMALGWNPRPVPRPVTALAAEGAAAAALVRCLLGRDDASLGTLRGVASTDRVVVEGPAEALPWVDGGRYLGRCPEAPGLSLPTAEDPTVPVGLLERALHGRGPQTLPCALWPGPDGSTVLCPLEGLRPLDRGCLLAWMGDP